MTCARWSGHDADHDAWHADLRDLCDLSALALPPGHRGWEVRVAARWHRSCPDVSGAGMLAGGQPVDGDGETSGAS